MLSWLIAKEKRGSKMGANKTFISGATDRKQKVVRNAEGFILVLGEFGQAIYG